MAYIKLEDLQKFPIRKDCYDKEHGNEHFIFGIETVIEYAENLPKADVVEVKHGEWLDNIESGTTVAGIHVSAVIGYKCSLCGRYEGRKEPYCNCGAKMDGRRDT